MTNVSSLPDTLAEVQRRIADLEAKADELRRKIIATGQSTIAGERHIASVRVATLLEFDLERLRKRVSEDQLDRSRVANEQTIITVHRRDSDE